jgi:hypothetical protein
MAACGISAASMSVVTQLNYDGDALEFELPVGHNMEGADYPPDPHPPKPFAFS